MGIDRFSSGKKIKIQSKQKALSNKMLSAFCFRDIIADFAKNRVLPIFLFLIILYGASASTIYSIITTSELASADAPISHKTSTTPSIGTIDTNSVPAPDTSLQQTNAAAANASPAQVGGKTAAFLSSAKSSVTTQPVAPVGSTAAKPVFTPHELVQDRTATSSTYLNANGTVTKTDYFSPHFYQTNGSWQPIDNTLETDDNAADSTNILGKALGAAESLISSPNAYKTTANNWEGRFAASNFSDGMVRIEEGGSQVGFSPVNANTVNPVITTNSDGEQVVHYDNLWNGIDVEYTVESTMVKEAVIINNKQAASQVQFKVIGADLQKPSIQSTPTNSQPAYNIMGALNNQFSVSPTNLILNNYGFVAPTTSGLTQSYDNGTLTEGVSSSYLQSLPSNAFPAVIDPSFGTRGEGSYMSFEQSGSTCYSSTCVLYAGDGYDSTETWQSWHGALYVPYSMFQADGVSLVDATLTLNQESGNSTWVGNTSTWNYQAGIANCLTSYTCQRTPTDNANIGTSGTIDVKDLYQAFISSGNYGGWIMLSGDDGTSNASFKAFNPDQSYVTFSYTESLPAPRIQTPNIGQVYTDPQVSFDAMYEANPNDSQALEYEWQVTNGVDGSGAVVNSDNYLNQTQWTVPDGVLQNGMTYYVEVRTNDQSTGVTSPWSQAVPFRLDEREGGDSTQTYDTVGPAKVDLATGNLETSAASHTTTALGGDLGVNLDYNSPIKSSPGLVGSYWDIYPGWPGGIPTTTPIAQRVDQNVNFDWNSNSPAAGVNPTFWAGQWTGYFEAPVTGNFNFGALNSNSMTINVNGTQVYNTNPCTSGPCFGSSIYLTAGQVVPIQIDGNFASSDIAQVFIKGAVQQQVLPTDWLQTGVRQLQTNGLLGKYYTFNDNGTPPSFPSDGTDGLFLTRVDPIINFDWTPDSTDPLGGYLPATNGPQAAWMTQWTGYVTVPTTGSYVFGTQSDDGSTVTVNGTAVYSRWADSTSSTETTGYGSSITLTAGQSVPITVDYFQHGGGAGMSLLVEPLGGSSEVVPTSWLTPYQPTLPTGWNLGINPSGTVSYTQLTASSNNAVLTDSSGDTYDYTWNGTGYSPPAGSSGFLDRNANGSWTLQDGSGETYVFNQAGNLASVTSAADATDGGASLTYTYANADGSGPITQITDGVNSNRWAKVYYSGASQCGSPPSGFGSTPTGMLCAVQTNDGRTTYFYYDTNGNLAEVAKPGNDDTTYQYQAVLNPSSSTIGYQMTGIRSDLANDAILAGERSASDASTYTQIGYDALGRVISVAEPAASAGASQLTKTFVYTPGQTMEHITGATEPAGYSEMVQYDYQYRTTLVYNNLGQYTYTQWDPEQDLQYSTTNPEGLMSTNLYNDLGQATSTYGPAPASDFNTWATTLANGQSMSEGQSLWSPDHRFQFTFQTDGNVVLYGPGEVALWNSGTSGHAATSLLMQTDGNLVLYNGSSAIWYTATSGDGPSTYLTVQDDGMGVLYNNDGPMQEFGNGGQLPAPGGESASGYDQPLSTYASQVARTDTGYDSGLTGLSTNYFAVSEPSPDDATLSGPPLLHTNNIASDGTISHTWGSTNPLPGGSGAWGLSMTGAMRLPTSGSWQFALTSNNGVRMWIDNQLVIDGWGDAGGSGTSTMTYTMPNVVANSVHSVRIDYYNLASQTNNQVELAATPPGGSQTSAVAGYFSPNYGLQTSSTSYDGSVGNTSVTTAYGSDPGLGQVASTTVDPTGLDLTTSDTYQTPGSGYGMLTSSTAPGGATTTYSYYGANDTAANPCVSGSPTAYQAGILKTVTQPSGETVTNVYDNSGNIVATETNSDGWECRTYDARGRITQDVIPSFNSNPSRTVTYNYDVGGNPLVGSETDSQGTITTTIDLLGRTVSYEDVYGDTTTTSYDSLGRVSGDSGPLGAEAYAYNNYNQLTSQSLNSTTLAEPTYDTYGRLYQVTYPTAGVTETVGYDTFGNLESESYTLHNGTVISDTDNHSESGKITSDTTAFGSSSSTWSYTYDHADRLTAASSTGGIGSNSYAYSFGSESGSCPTGTNANAGMDGNRTSQTINGTTTTYCYNSADQLIGSSNPYVDAATYDSHGNTTRLGDSGDQTSFAYDSSDRTASITQGSQSTTYGYDAADDITARNTNNGSGTTSTLYGYTGSGDSFAMNNSLTVTQDYVSLPGGLSLTINPGQTGAAALVASLSNIEGNVIATVDGDEDESGEFTYDPFGNPVGSSGQPGNSTNNAAFGWAGGADKITETAMTLTPIQMGARVYIPTIGRFLSEDPDPGSLPNLYTYPLDPINSSDLSGESLFGSIASVISNAVKVVAKTIAHVVAVVASSVVDFIKSTQTTSRATAPAVPATSSRASSAPVSSTKPVVTSITTIARTSSTSTAVNPLTIQKGPGNTNNSSSVTGGGDSLNYSANGFLQSAASGCAFGGAMLGSIGAMGAMFTDGLSAIAGVADGCEGGAEGGIVIYLLTGQNILDTSSQYDARNYIHENVP